MPSIPSRQIDFRYTIPAGTGVELAHIMLHDAVLTGGFMHFPDGCNGVVQARILLQRQGLGNVETVTPQAGAYVALNDSQWEFQLDEEIAKDDEIIVGLVNNGIEDHTITVVVTEWFASPKQRAEESKDPKVKHLPPGRMPVFEGGRPR